MTSAEPHVDRREALAIFYARCHKGLAWRVRRRARLADDTIVSDACGFAWLELVRRPDIRLDASGLSWLTIVAVHEAIRLVRPRERPVGSFVGAPADANELPEPMALTGDPLDRAIALETQQLRVGQFAALKPRERRELFLGAAGFTYREIATLTASTYTAINRRMREGRAQLLRS
jgi:DNA-directed RNA polymerase specialized sigma24 family protein